MASDVEPVEPARGDGEHLQRRVPLHVLLLRQAPDRRRQDEGVRPRQHLVHLIRPQPPERRVGDPPDAARVQVVPVRLEDVERWLSPNLGYDPSARRAATASGGADRQ